MRVKEQTTEQREQHLQYQREYGRKKRQALAEEQANRKANATRRIAAAILVAEATGKF